MFSCQLVEILEYKVRKSIKQYKYSTPLYPKTFYLFKQHIMLIWYECMIIPRSTFCSSPSPGKELHLYLSFKLFLFQFYLELKGHIQILCWFS